MANQDPEATLGGIAPAMWSIYYHSIYLPTLRKSVLELVQAPSSAETPLGDLLVGRGKDVATLPAQVSALLGVQTQPATTVAPPLRLLPLAQAANAVLIAKDKHARHRRLQALRKLASLGLANPEYRAKLIETGGDEVRINEAGEVVDLLVQKVWEEFTLKPSITDLQILAPAEANTYLDTAMSLSGVCAPIATSCVACYSPRGAAGGEPITKVTTSCYVKRDLDCLAKNFDPRSWQSCMSVAFKKSQRVDYDRITGKYTDVSHSDPPAIGKPWKGHLEEQVVVGGDSEFQNWLTIDFQVTPNSVRVDYEFHESGIFSIPSLLIFNEVESVVVNDGYMLAENSTNPLYPASANWKRMELTKTIRFVDLTNLPGSNPWNIDPGEVMNYWAPVLFSEWLESGTQIAVCCDC